MNSQAGWWIIGIGPTACRKRSRAFENLRGKKQKIDLESTQLKGPSSTWTYFINDDQFGWGIQMLSGKNIGFAVAAGSGINLPIFLLLIWLKRFFRRKST